MTTPDWTGVLETVAAAGWTACVVPAGRLDDVRARVAGVLASGELPGPVAEHLVEETAFEVPAEPPEARSVVIAAVARPVTLAELTVDGAAHTVVVPPHYAGYHTTPPRLAAAVAEALEPWGYGAVTIHPPLKTLAACSGLAAYGRNNIVYVAGLGSYLQLAACVSDAPPPGQTDWGEPELLERCERCSSCLHACPTGAVAGDRFLLHTDRCLTRVNEDEEPFPAWVDPAWHHCAVGCLRCQQACPENATVRLTVAPAQTFDAEESAAILTARPRESLDPATREKLALCGLDYSPALIARNLRALAGG